MSMKRASSTPRSTTGKCLSAFVSGTCRSSSRSWGISHRLSAQVARGVRQNAKLVRAAPKRGGAAVTVDGIPLEERSVRRSSRPLPLARRPKAVTEGGASKARVPEVARRSRATRVWEGQGPRRQRAQRAQAGHDVRFVHIAHVDPAEHASTRRAGRGGIKRGRRGVGPASTTSASRARLARARHQRFAATGRARKPSCRARITQCAWRSKDSRYGQAPSESPCARCSSTFDAITRIVRVVPSDWTWQISTFACFLPAASVTSSSSPSSACSLPSEEQPTKDVRPARQSKTPNRLPQMLCIVMVCMGRMGA